MRRFKVISECFVIFFVGAILYVCLVGGAIYRNVRKELRKKQ